MEISASLNCKAKMRDGKKIYPIPAFAERIKILTLNCWGVFLKPMTVKKDNRIEAIGEMLLNSESDIIFLQEVWMEADFEKLKNTLNPIYPYSIKFYAQLFGSGVCIFCKWPLTSFLTMPFSVNGYPQYIHQADWPAGKSVGFASTVTPGGFRLNLYNAHTHARYHLNHENDPVEGHRLTQAIEMMELIRISAASADAVFIGGDLNLEPYTTALRLLKRSLGLKDAWLDQTARQPVVSVEEMEIEGATCERCDCPYANKKWTKAYPNGIRVDYIFYRSGVIKNGLANVSVECEKCQVSMSEVPNQPGLFYSDHAIVTGDFVIRRHKTPISEETPPINSGESLEDLLIEADNIIERQMQKENKKKIIQLVIAFFLIAAFLTLGTAVPMYHHPASKFLTTVVLMMVGACIFALIWGNAIGRACIMSSLLNAKAIIWNHLRETAN
ncbi:hypothetical protein Aperf_G00000008338 [Anoplocephala perfoliata]